MLHFTWTPSGPSGGRRQSYPARKERSIFWGEFRRRGLLSHLINLHLSEGIVDLGGGELHTEGHEGVPEKSFHSRMMMAMMIMVTRGMTTTVMINIDKESLPEGIGIDLAVHLEGLEGSKDDIVVIGASGHLGGEEGDHLGEVHGAVHLVEHGLESITHEGQIRRKWYGVGYFQLSAYANHQIAKEKATKNVNIKTAKSVVVISGCERTWAPPSSSSSSS